MIRKFNRISNVLLSAGFLKEHSLDINITDLRLDSLFSDGFGVCGQREVVLEELRDMLIGISKSVILSDCTVNAYKEYWVNLLNGINKTEFSILESAVYRLLSEDGLLEVAGTYFKSIPLVYDIQFMYSKPHFGMKEVNLSDLKNGIGTCIIRIALKYSSRHLAV